MARGTKCPRIQTRDIPEAEIAETVLLFELQVADESPAQRGLVDLTAL